MKILPKGRFILVISSPLIGLELALYPELDFGEPIESVESLSKQCNSEQVAGGLTSQDSFSFVVSTKKDNRTLDTIWGVYRHLTKTSVSRN